MSWLRVCVNSPIMKDEVTPPYHCCLLFVRVLESLLAF
jgi:hypothetical protein